MDQIRAASPPPSGPITRKPPPSEGSQQFLFAPHVEPELEFASQPPASLHCPICQDVFDSPVITADCSHTFCRICLLKQLELDRHCPLCRGAISPSSVHPNLVAQGVVDELPVYCRYRSRGCDQHIPRAGKRTHERYCGWAPVFCPHRPYGCAFEGSRNSLDTHLLTCAYEQLKPFIGTTRAEIAALESQLAELRSALAQLSTGGGKHVHLQTPPPLRHFPASTPMLMPTAIDAASTLSSSPPPSSPVAFQCVATLQAHTRGVTALCLHSATARLFTGSHDASILVWDLRTLLGRSAAASGASSSQGAAGGGGGDKAALSTSAGNSSTLSVSIASSDPAAPDASVPLATLQGAHTSTVWSLLIWREMLFSASADATIRVHSIAPPFSRLKPVLRGHTSRIYALVATADRLISAGADRQIKVWDPLSAQCVRTLTGHAECVWSLYLPADELAAAGTGATATTTKAVLYSASEDGTIRVWDLQQFTCIQTVSLAPAKLLSLTGNGVYLFVSTHSCNIRLLRLDNFEAAGELTGHSWEVWQLAMCGSRYLLSGSFDHSVRVWDLETKQCVRVLDAHKGYVHSIVYHSAEKLLITGGGDRSVKLWRA